jgi:hypothetical protein
MDNVPDRADVVLPLLRERQGLAQWVMPAREMCSRSVLNECAGNPLLLTMIAIDAHDEGGLPATRSDLFGRMYEMLVLLRTQKKRIEEPLPPEKKKELLRAMASR